MSFSFTLEVWLLLPPDSPATEPQPVFCTLSGVVCLWLVDRKVHARYGDNVIDSATHLSLAEWHNVMFRYDGQVNVYVVKAKCIYSRI
jgi:hypothetical protein